MMILLVQPKTSMLTQQNLNRSFVNALPQTPYNKNLVQNMVNIEEISEPSCNDTSDLHPSLGYSTAKDCVTS